MKDWVDLRCDACGAVSFGPAGSQCKLGHRARAMITVVRAPARKFDTELTPRKVRKARQPPPAEPTKTTA